ncbi:Sensor histidine kinase TmoS [Vanrija pseudolonga]|uniref:Sensor histidine kinase TmoS n=1 Tax=Vanrija pseudolonga TaxID=143232 RepID=A0AAF0YBP2_9TREE|nr:Sensor histidine kinase TmoS [Vanrija pseudolonga]
MSATSSASITAVSASPAAAHDSDPPNVAQLRYSSIDLSTLPRDFLESYPYPAFVLVVPIQLADGLGDAASSSSSTPLAPTSFARLHPFVPVWTNKRWRRLARGRSLLDCLSLRSMRSLGDWVQGRDDADLRDTLPLGALSLNTGPSSIRGSSRAGVMSRSGSTGSSQQAASLGSSGPKSYSAFGAQSTGDVEGGSFSFSSDPSDLLEADRAESTLTLDFILTATPITLQLSRTVRPLYQMHNGNRMLSKTNRFVVVTTVPVVEPLLPAPERQASMDTSPQLSVYAMGTPQRRHSLRSLDDDRSPMGSNASPGTLASISPMATPIATAPEPSPSLLNQAGQRLGHGTVPPVASPPLVSQFPPGGVLETHKEDVVKDMLPPDWVEGLPVFFANGSSWVPRPPLTQPGSHETDGTPHRSQNVEKLIETLDWSKTPLGPREGWPESLTSILTLIMNYPIPACVWWGEELTMIYNQWYAGSIIDHPEAFGQSGTAAWEKIYRIIGPLTEVVLHGTAIFNSEVLETWKQYEDEVPKESYIMYTFIPLKSAEGVVSGVFQAALDRTPDILGARRNHVLHEVAKSLSFTSTRTEFDTKLLAGLEEDPKDIPFAMIYDVEHHQDYPSDTGKPEERSTGERYTRYWYSGGFGAAEVGHRGVPEHALVALEPPGSRRPSHTPVFEEDAEIDRWPFEEAMRTQKPVLVPNCAKLIEGFPIRVWDELPTSAVLLPLARQSEDSTPASILVIGLSSRLTYDQAYEEFFQSLALVLSASLSSVRSREADTQRLADLEALSRAKSMLFSNLSHELFTPLTLISGPLDDLAESLEDDEEPLDAKKVKGTLDLARKHVGSLTRLVTIIMDASTLEAGRTQPTFQRLNFGNYILETVSVFRDIITEAPEIQFTIDVDTEPHDVYLDRETLEKLLVVLIGNWFKFTKRGSTRTSLRYTSKEAVLTIEGTAMADDADGGLTRAEPVKPHEVAMDSGERSLIINYARKLVELQRGEYETETTQSANATTETHMMRFHLGTSHLPIDAIDSSGAGGFSKQASAGSDFMVEIRRWRREWLSSMDIGKSLSSTDLGTGRGPEPSMTSLHPDDVIMVVHHIKDTRKYMRRILERYCTVTEAVDGQDAMDIWNKNPPDLVIADVTMPRLNGYGLLSALRSGTREQQSVPFIILTALDDERPRGGQGADDYLTKPFNATQLVSRVQTQLQLGRRSRTLENLYSQRTTELRMLTEHAPVGIFRMTHDGFISYCNPAYYSIYGLPATTIGSDWAEGIADGDRERVVGLWTEFASSKNESVTMEYQCLHSGRWVSETSIKVNKKDAGVFTDFIGCIVDITARKLNEDLQAQRVLEAEKRRAEAEEAREQQELLIDITSHEIRNPISSLMQCSELVKSNLQSLQEQLTDVLDQGKSYNPTRQLLFTISEDLDALESIYQCALTQERICNDVLSLGKVHLDMLQMYDVDTDIRKEAAKILAVFQNEARMTRTTLEVEYADSFDELGLQNIMTDRVRLGQVITNLVSNAVRFTANSPVRHVTLSLDIGLYPPVDESCLKPPDLSSPAEDRRNLTQDSPIYCYFSVKDTGPGMTPDELELLFQRFSQASAKVHTVFGGSGLGLFVCRKIVERMGGRIEVVSDYGVGTVFRFFIEAHPVLPEIEELIITPSLAEDDELPESSTSPLSPPLPAEPQFKRNSLKDRSLEPAPKYTPHVLVVEDNLINRKLLVRQLKHVGITVDSVVNGLEGLETVAKAMAVDGPSSGRYDAVLMDLEMPVMGGLMATRRIRELEEQGVLVPSHVIALTGNARQVQVDASMADFNAVLVKPYRLDELLRNIDDMVRLRGAEGGDGGNEGSGNVPQPPQVV